MLSNDLFAFVITLVVALVWLRLNDFAAHRGWVSGRLSRKIIHMGTGPIFVLCWPLFTNSAASPYIAALVPLAITGQFILVGLGYIQDEAAVQAMTRTGDRREILRGPLFYGIVFVVMTILFWYKTPTGIVALMLMCGGDGLADILGRRYGKSKLPWSPDKSWIGSLGMFIGGLVFSVIIVAIFSAMGIFQGSLMAYIFPIAIIAIAGTIVESLPYHDIDNITVTLTAVILGMLFW
jgi:phytol kinase